jgi:methylmalonyl-CoA/ethylmalonyl-CoA epimerase
MKNKLLIFCLMILISCGEKSAEITETPEHFKHVDQVFWVINDMDKTINHWAKLGFDQVMDMGTVDVNLKKSGKTVKIRMAKANMGGAHITWIQPPGDGSLFSEFYDSYGEGAMSLVHRLDSKKALKSEIKRLSVIGVNVKEEIDILTDYGNLTYYIMDTRDEGTFYLGLTYSDNEIEMTKDLTAENLHNMDLNQYAFAIRNENIQDVSAYWHKIGFPEFEINHPELGKKHYYDSEVDHDLIQGWQRHGDIAYEWCIPVSTPIVYDDHIKKHGEGIHHLAFAVNDMDKVLEDYKAKGYVVSMGGTWGDEGQPGSGRYEYIDLEDAGGVTMELLWSFD